MQPDQEQRIEEMLEVEQELAAQYEAAQEPEIEDNEPEVVDSRLGQRTGRIVGFERVAQGHQSQYAGRLRIEYLKEGGDTSHDFITWPDDPTDETEPLVRLCQHLGVEMDRLADLQGAYVPLNWAGDVDIPPIQTRGNRAKYHLERFFHTHPRIVRGIEAVIVGILALSWIGGFALIYSLQAYTYEGSGWSGLAALFLIVIILIASLASLGLLLVIIADCAKQVHARLFPKA